MTPAERIALIAARARKLDDVPKKPKGIHHAKKPEHVSRLRPVVAPHKLPKGFFRLRDWSPRPEPDAEIKWLRKPDSEPVETLGADFRHEPHHLDKIAEKWPHKPKLANPQIK